jgi:peptide/nickel transport system substrate-binding protein
MIEALRGRSVAALAVVVSAALLASGCGSSGSGSDTERTTLRGTTSAFPDALDPALTMSQEGWSALWNSYIPLLTYPHAEGKAGTRLIPGLARALPEVSADGRTYTLYLREGLRYSDGTPVRASDFPASVERLIEMNSGATAYFTDIVGAERFAATGRGGIAGIEADDASGRITIRLVQPRGTFPYELATLAAALVPAGTPAEDLSADPPPATGPYEFADVRPGRSWEYRRNPEWEAGNAERLEHLPDGNFDRIEMRVDSNPAAQVTDVERGEFDWMVNPPAPDQIAGLRQRFEGTQLIETPLIGVFYFWMNTTEPPFDDPRVRRAVNYAIAPAALERIYAGMMKPLQQILPPGMPGSEPFAPYPHDMKRARTLIAAAAPAEREVTVWTNNFPTNQEAGEYYAGVLGELGFEPNLKALNTTNYFGVVSNLNTPDLDTGWGNWLLEYPHPNSYFEPQLTADAITETNNSNWARFDNPALTAEVNRLRREQLGPEQEAAYARLDRAYMRQAPWAPFGQFTMSTFVSENVDPGAVVVSPVYGQDLASFEPN